MLEAQVLLLYNNFDYLRVDMATRWGGAGSGRVNQVTGQMGCK